MAKRALCIGINNYPGTDMDLSGCINDANDWAEVLSARKFEVAMLLDKQATRAAMAKALSTLIGGAVKGDVIVITFSGHGTTQPDDNGDEADGIDEGFAPHDIVKSGALTDDEIHAIFLSRQAGVRITMLADSCHSGTVTRAVAPDPDAASGPRPRFLPMGHWLSADRMPRGASGQPATRVDATGLAASAFSQGLSRAAGDVLLAGCQEGENHFSYDTRFRDRPNGAFTYYALKAMRTLEKSATYADWHAAIGQYLPTPELPQVPQLFASSTARQRKIFN